MRLTTLTIYFIIIGLHANAQSDIIKYEQEENTCVCEDESEDFTEIALLEIIKKTDFEDNGYLACAHHCLALYYYNNLDLFGDIQQNKIALQIREKNQDPLLWKSYRNIGYTYVQVGYYKKGIVALEKAMQLNETLAESVIAHIQISLAHTKLGEYKKALQYAHKALNYAHTNKNSGRAYNNLSFVHEEIADTKNLELAVKYAREAIEFCEQAEWQYGVSIASGNLGNALELLERYDEAIEAHNVLLQNYPKEDIGHATILNNIGLILNKQNNYPEAIKTLNESLETKQKYYLKAYHPDYSPNYENLADSYTSLGKYQTAINYYNTALDNLKDKPKSDNPYIYNKPDLLRVLDLKAQAALKSGNIDLAYDTYQELDNWINQFYKDLSTKASKLTWIDRLHTIYGNAIEVAVLKKDNEKAFQYAEKAHAVLLWQSLSRQAARNLLLEDDKEKMDELNAQIRQADEQYRYGEITLDALRKLERERDNLEATFDEQYETYAQRKYQPETTTVSDIQANITDEHTAFIEYYRTNKNLYIFVITKNDIEIIQENADGLADDITDFVNNISEPEKVKAIQVNLQSNDDISYKLYQQLIPPNLRSNEKINRLVIVPDREIGTLPFAALTTQATSGKLNKNTPFLIKKYTLNYLYSAGSYLQLQQKKADQKYCFAGIAPIEYAHGEWQNLSGAEGELNEMKSQHWSWNREILMREKATKTEFERIIKEGYRTIQVSTHAVFDENKGQIIFHDSALNQDEIDQLEINTHRLILSACETGVGTQNQGEGILSLGWNFAYKGVPSITMTHWSVNDNSTKNIMVEYHKNLHDGISADQALRAAQITYLNEHTPSDKAFSPYYWAGIFHTGNVR